MFCRDGSRQPVPTKRLFQKLGMIGREPMVIREAVITPLVAGPITVIFKPALSALGVAGATRVIFVPFVPLVNVMV